MKGYRMTQQRRLNLIAAIILLVGLGSAVMIYSTADDSNSTMGYEVINGQLYPVQPDKMYIHNLEMYGGGMAVTANEISHWFAQRWHGSELAFTIGYIAIFISFCLALIARHLNQIR